MASEVKWSCGCHEVDGKLVEQCSQVPVQGEIASHQRVVFSRKCARLANTNAVVQPVPPAPEPDNGRVN